MAMTKHKLEAGQNKKRSSQDHWELATIIKAESKKVRRKEGKKICRQALLGE